TNWQRFEAWSVSVVSISVAFSFFGALASVLPPETSMGLEIPLIAIVLGFWCAGLPAILDPDNSLAVSPENAILNANLFFFSYASLLFCILLLGSWFEQKNGDSASPTALGWVLLVASSLVAMSSAIAVMRTDSCKKDSSSYCNRTRFAIYGGMASTIVSFVMVFLRGKAPIVCQGFIGLLLFIVWACGISYITFGSGPGTILGSLYFSTWASFFIAINLTATCAQIFIHDNDIKIVSKNSQNEGGEAAAAEDKKEEGPKESDDKA
ncbi:MAG: hypothetical protein SGILL_009638, partial [Bacillariaceae sp.]